MNRDFICVFGNQGYGKSVWAKTYARARNRLFVFDPLASYSGVDFVSEPDDYIPSIIRRERESFRVGTYYAEELPLFSHAAMAAGKCSFIIEECALIFRRGQELHDWAKPLVFTGRHPEVDLILIAQRAAKIPIDIRSQASRVITFLQTEPDDVDAICERMNTEPEDVSTLKPLECLDWKAGGNSVSRYSVAP